MAPCAGYDRLVVTEFRTTRVAAIQATSVILDAEASVEKAIGLIGDAAADGAELAVLPETFVSLYPSNIWARAAAGFGGFDELWERMWESSLDVPGPLVERLVEACAGHRVHCVIGVNDDLRVVDTPVGRVGGLICWENRMPLARWAVYQGGPQIWAAPTADDSDAWLASMRHIAIESGAYVVSVPQYIPRSAFPSDFPVDLPEKDVYGRGGAVIVEPASGELIAGPLYDAEGIIVADCDLRRGLHAKRSFDAIGHYARSEVLAPALGGAPSDADDLQRAPPDA